MKKILFVFASLFFTANAFASVATDFKNNIAAGDIGGYARDIGRMVGVTDFHDGKAVASFPGFDVGAAAIFMDPSNKIDSSADNSVVFMPMLYGNAKLPILGFNLVLRGTSYDGFSTMGGGVKYTLVGNTILPFFPDIAVGANYDRMTTNYYGADHFSAYISASLKVLVFEPYLGFGYDYTDLEVKSTGTSYDGKSYSGDGGRTTIGLNVTPFPFTYVFGSYTYAGNTKIYQAGLGVRF